MVRKDAFRKIAPDLFLNADDAPLYGLDICLKIRRQGYKILFDPGAWVHHFPAPRFPGIPRGNSKSHIRAYNRNYTYIAFTHYPFFKRSLFFFYFFLVGEREGGFGLASGILARIRGRSDAISSAFLGKLEGITAVFKKRLPYPTLLPLRKKSLKQQHESKQCLRPGSDIPSPPGAPSLRIEHSATLRTEQNPRKGQPPPE